MEELRETHELIKKCSEKKGWWANFKQYFPYNDVEKIKDKNDSLRHLAEMGNLELQALKRTGSDGSSPNLQTSSTAPADSAFLRPNADLMLMTTIPNHDNLALLATVPDQNEEEDKSETAFSLELNFKNVPRENYQCHDIHCFWQEEDQASVRIGRNNLIESKLKLTPEQLLTISRDHALVKATRPLRNVKKTPEKLHEESKENLKPGESQKKLDLSEFATCMEQSQFPMDSGPSPFKEVPPRPSPKMTIDPRGPAGLVVIKTIKGKEEAKKLKKNEETELEENDKIVMIMEKGKTSDPLVFYKVAFSS